MCVCVCVSASVLGMCACVCDWMCDCVCDCMSVSSLRPRAYVLTSCWDRLFPGMLWFIGPIWFETFLGVCCGAFDVFLNHEVASCSWCCSSLDVFRNYMTIGAIVRHSCLLFDGKTSLNATVCFNMLHARAPRCPCLILQPTRQLLAEFRARHEGWTAGTLLTHLANLHTVRQALHTSSGSWKKTSCISTSSRTLREWPEAQGGFSLFTPGQISKYGQDQMKEKKKSPSDFDKTRYKIPPGIQKTFTGFGGEALETSLSGWVKQDKGQMAEEFDTGTIGTIGTIAVPCSHTSCMMLHVPSSCTSEGSHLHVLLGFDCWKTR